MVLSKLGTPAKRRVISVVADPRAPLSTQTIHTAAAVSGETADAIVAATERPSHFLAATSANSRSSGITSRTNFSAHFANASAALPRPRRFISKARLIR